ncbi:MAG: hypothetical protein ACWA5K_01615, partial [bacterium]
MASRWIRWFVALCCCALLQTQVSAKTVDVDEPSIIGKAYRQSAGTLIYTEEHFLPSQSIHRVIYRSNEGVVIAEKQIDYQASLTAPDFEQHNRLVDRSISAVRVDNQFLLNRFQKDADTHPKEARIPVNEALVVDAGFDHFVREHWELLIKGISLTFDFLLPTRQRTVELAIKNIACDPPDNAQCFMITPANTLLKWLADPIRLSYDPHTRQLLA